MYSLYPPETECRFNGFKEGQSGLFYDPRLNTLIVGKIEDHCLKGRVIHNGVTQKDIDEGRYFAAWNKGYSYNNWDKWDMIYVGRYSTHTNYYAYMDFISNSELTVERINAFHKAQELLKDDGII